MNSVSKNRKVFCIGLNKTGTTSLAKALEELGYDLGDLAAAEALLEDWARRDFHRIIEYCQTADVFRDIPFSLDFTYQALDAAYPDSKFILTVRNSTEEWYHSLTQYHSKLFGRGSLPDEKCLAEAPYHSKGWVLRAMQLIANPPPGNLYCKQTLMQVYELHNMMATKYFRNRPDDLLVLNVSEPAAYRQLCAFLRHSVVRESFPWENRTADIELP